jgi:hypothetical protein
MQCGAASNGTGTTPPEQVIAVPSDGRPGPILPGDEMVWQSVQTGLYCRVVQDAGVGKIRCDMLSPADASPLVYTGTGTTYENRPLINPGGSQPLYFGAAGAAVPALPLSPAPGPALQPDQPFLILSNSTGVPVRNDNASWPAYVGNGVGTTSAEQYRAYDPANPNSTTAMAPGASVILKNDVSAALAARTPLTCPHTPALFRPTICSLAVVVTVLRRLIH